MKKENNTIPIHINIHDGRYFVQKNLEGKTYSFGIFEKIENAIKWRDKMIEHNWDRQYYKNNILNAPEYKNKYIYLSRGKYCITRRNKNGVKRTYGSYDTLRKARKIRNQLIKNNWETEYDMEHIETLKDNSFRIMRTVKENNKDFRYYYGTYNTLKEAQDVRDQLIIEGFPENKITCKTDIMHHIHTNRTNGVITGYTVRRYTNKKRTTYITTHKLKDIIALRDIIESNNWKILTPNIYKHNKYHYVITITPYNTNKLVGKYKDKDEALKILNEELDKLN